MDVSESFLEAVRDHAMVRSDPDGWMIAQLASLVISCREELEEAGCNVSCVTLTGSTRCTRCRVLDLINDFESTLVRS